jgi:cysteine desulfurase
VREGVALQPLQFGGRHERERRPGTENVYGIAALGAAARWWHEHGAAERETLASLRDWLAATLMARVANACVYAAGAPRTPNTLSIGFQNVSAQALLIALDLAGFAVSTGSACSSGSVEPSPVLLAMGCSAAAARSALRISLGRGNDRAQCAALAEAIESAVARQRAGRGIAA